MTQSDPIAILGVSPPRRIVTLAVQAGVGVLLIVFALRRPDLPPAGIAALIALGALVLWQSRRMYRATARHIVLTRAGLHDSTGTLIAPLENIATVDRSLFALKPSNGFLLRLTEPAPGAWVPGLWWRYGTRVGIGGATSGKAARDMAEIIQILKSDPAAGLPPEA